MVGWPDAQGRMDGCKDDSCLPSAAAALPHKDLHPSFPPTFFPIATHHNSPAPPR